MAKHELTRGAVTAVILLWNGGVEERKSRVDVHL